MQSRAEQSRAEQSRAEQSRAEHKLCRALCRQVGQPTSRPVSSLKGCLVSFVQEGGAANKKTASSL